MERDEQTRESILSTGILEAEPKGLLDFARDFKDGVSSNFKSIASEPGVEVYQSNDDYVVSVDLAAGASLDILQGESVESGKKSVYGGPNPDFKRMSGDEALAKERKTFPNAVCVVNAEFFANFNRTAVPLAFSLREDGTVLSEGFAGIAKHDGNRLTLAIAEHSARIIPFNNNKIDEFRNLKESNALVSLSPRVNIDGSAEAKIGRTFLGLGNPDANGNYTRVLIFGSKSSSQAHAELTLRRFGAGPTIMLDGGSSSMMIWKNRHLVDTSRTVPSFLAVIPAQKKQIQE